MEKVVLGFSGGVDSTLAALLLREHYEVIAVYLHDGETDPTDAISGAASMDIPFHLVDTKDAMENLVCKPFSDSYLRGETPNPCIICNRAVKFRYLCEYADNLGAKYIATGHYAKTDGGALFKGMPQNDQSYMLCRLSQEQVNRLILPLGTYNKDEVRTIARQHKLGVANKPDSMDICFIPDGDHAAWMERRGDAAPAGDVILNGERIARHEGIHRYTVGQRRGLGFAAGRRVYVSELRPETNEVILSDSDVLYSDRVYVRDFNYLCENLSENEAYSCKVRHSKAQYSVHIKFGDTRSELCLYFDEPVRAPVRGQSAVLYQGDRLMGGGFIL